MASPARAEERTDLVRDITAIALKTQDEQINRSVVPLMMKEMGAADAGLTADETAMLEAGLRATLIEVVAAIYDAALSDPQRFQVEDLRQIKAFLSTPAGGKWTAVAANFDAKDPKFMQAALTAMFKNIDMKIFAKLAVAMQVKKQAGK